MNVGVSLIADLVAMLDEYRQTLKTAGIFATRQDVIRLAIEQFDVQRAIAHIRAKSHSRPREGSR